MNIIAIVVTLALLIVYIVYQVVWARDRGQRGRTFQKLAEYFDGAYDIEPPRELRERLTALGQARVLTARHHLRVENEGGGFDIVDLRYLYSREGRNRMATSTVGRFDCDCPAFRSTVVDGRRETIGDDPQAVQERVVPRLAAVDGELDDAVVEGDGEQVLVYRWRCRLQPDQIPAFKELMDAVSSAFRT